MLSPVPASCSSHTESFHSLSVMFLCLWDKVFLHCPGWPQAHSGPLSSASQVLGIRVYTIWKQPSATKRFFLNTSQPGKPLRLLWNYHQSTLNVLCPAITSLPGLFSFIPPRPFQVHRSLGLPHPMVEGATPPEGRKSSTQQAPVQDDVSGYPEQLRLRKISFSPLYWTM